MSGISADVECQAQETRADDAQGRTLGVFTPGDVHIRVQAPERGSA